MHDPHSRQKWQMNVDGVVEECSALTLKPLVGSRRVTMGVRTSVRVSSSPRISQKHLRYLPSRAGYERG